MTVPCPRVLIAERDRDQFLARFIDAIATDAAIFLGNPDWPNATWQDLEQLVQPNTVWGDVPCPTTTNQHLDPPGKIMIPTGGSSGNVRFVMHTPETLTASVQGFQAQFKLGKIRSFCILPLYHVSGLMQFWRAKVTQGEIFLGDYTALKKGIFPQLSGADWLISLVPTQLQTLLTVPGAIAWLQQFQFILLGGAPAWPELLAKARSRQLRLALTYGMTETASQIVTLHPDDFLAGNESTGQVLPHAQVQLNAVGQIVIQARSLGLGYFPHCWPEPRQFITDDRGEFDEFGYLQILGRMSRKIITGGENVYPEPIEALIRGTSQVQEICIVGVPDQQWGEKIIAVYVPEAHFKLTEITTLLQQKIPHWQLPKQWLLCNELPRNAQGKINYTAVQEWANIQLNLRLRTGQM